MGCEEYKQDDEIDAQHNCPVHRKPCIHREEENFFFRLSSYQQQLEVSMALHLLQSQEDSKSVQPALARYYSWQLAELSSINML